MFPPNMCIIIIICLLKSVRLSNFSDQFSLSSIPLSPFIPSFALSLPPSPSSLVLLSLLRKYQAANLSINLFFVDSRFAFSYAWCVGAQSVTTNNCEELASMAENKFYQVTVH